MKLSHASTLGKKKRNKYMVKIVLLRFNHSRETCPIKASAQGNFFNPRKAFK